MILDKSLYFIGRDSLSTNVFIAHTEYTSYRVVVPCLFLPCSRHKQNVKLNCTVTIWISILRIKENVHTDTFIFTDCMLMETTVIQSVLSEAFPKHPYFIYNRPNYDIQKTIIWELRFHVEDEWVRGRREWLNKYPKMWEEKKVWLN